MCFLLVNLHRFCVFIRGMRLLLYTCWNNLLGTSLRFYVFLMMKDAVLYTDWNNLFGTCNTYSLVFYFFGNLNWYCVFIVMKDAVLYTGGSICRFMCLFRWFLYRFRVSIQGFDVMLCLVCFLRMWLRHSHGRSFDCFGVVNDGLHNNVRFVCSFWV